MPNAAYLLEELIECFWVAAVEFGGQGAGSEKTQKGAGVEEADEKIQVVVEPRGFVGSGHNVWERIGYNLGMKIMVIKSWSVQAKVVAVLILAYFVLFANLGWREYEGLKMQMNDMGNVVQAIYNTTAGRVMEFSNAYVYDNPVTNRLGGHANWIFFLLVPVLALVPDPRVLILVQTAVAGSGMLPLYLLSKKYLPKGWWRLLVPVLYATSPIIADAVLFDFHALVIAMPLAIWAMYLMLTKKFGWFVVAAALLVLCKEDMPLVVAMMGIYWWRVLGEKRKGMGVLAGSLIYFVLMVGVVMPVLRAGQVSVVEMRYGELGNGIWGVIVGMVTKPGLVARLILSPEKLAYVLGLLMSGGFMSLWAPAVVAMALPSLVINLLSSNSMMYQSYGYYYPAVNMAVVMVAAVVGLGRLREDKPKKWKMAGGGMLALGMLLSWLYSPVPGSRVSSRGEFGVSEHARLFEEVERVVPKEASVSVQNNLGASLAMRRRIITFPYGVGEAEFVVLDVADPYEVVRVSPRQRNFVYITGMSLADYRSQVEAMFGRSDYGVVHASDGYLVFEKGKTIDSKEARAMFEGRMRGLEERYQSFTTSYAGDGG